MTRYSPPGRLALNVIGSFLFAIGIGRAQTPLKLPEASPAAQVAQTVGMTEIQIAYHRPAVNGRKIWDGLVPHNQVWRAGANENTTIRFSSPVTVEGKKLPAATYGLHMIPGEKEWTIAFSKVSTAWGSYSYDPKEDAARIDKTVVASLRWEKLAVPFRIEVDTPAVVVESLRSQLRGLPRFSWQGWNQAAAYCLEHDVNLEEARRWADESIQLNENFQNLRVKAALLEKSGDAKTAEALRARATKIAGENDLNLYGYQLLAQKKFEDAIAVFERNTREHPRSWNVWDSLAEAYATQGNKKAAIENYSKALSMAPESQSKRIQEAIAKLKA